MNERYRYGYGDEPGERESTFSRHGSMTDQRADVDHRGRSDEEDEERQADQIRQADSETPAPAAEPAAGGEPAASAERTAPSSSSSVFDVEEEETTGSDRVPPGQSPRPDTAAERETAGAAAGAGPAGDGLERPPIALGPPPRTTDEAPAAAPADELDSRPEGAPAASGGTSVFETAGTAKPEAATPVTGTPTDETPAAASTGAGSPESEPAVQSTPGTETEMLVPGSGPAPAAAPDERAALLGALDADAIRARFLDIQAGFVDEPRQAVQEAERYVDELVQGLVRALEAERAKLRATIEDGSTEDLRIAIRGYRAFVDRLLNLSM